MRTAILTCLCAVSGYIATAQFNLIPSVGVENFRSGVKYNGLSPADGICLPGSAQGALKLEYLFKKNHGPYITAATNRSIVEYSFADPETGNNVYQTAAGNTQLRLEGGYQAKTKRFFLNSRPSGNKQENVSSAGHCERKAVQSRCGTRTEQAKKTSRGQGAWMRLVPSVGFAYIPDAPASAIASKTNGTQTTHTYNAGNWRTAVGGGMGFEFGKNERSLLSLSLNYLHAFGEGLDAKKITTVEGNKTTSTILSSNASAWNLRLGVPFNLLKRKTVKEAAIEKVYIREVKKCGESKMQYKPRCYKTYYEQ